MLQPPQKQPQLAVWFVSLLFLALTPYSQLAAQTTAIDDPTDDALICRTGRTSTSKLPDGMDIIRAEATLTDEGNYQFLVTFDGAPLGTQEFAGGIELYDPSGDLVASDRNWFFNTTGNISFNVNWSANSLSSSKAVVQSGGWSQDNNSGYTAEKVGDTAIQFNVPAEEVFVNGSGNKRGTSLPRWLMTATNSTICDEAGLGSDDLPGIALPGGIVLLTNDNYRGSGSTEDPVSTFTGELFLNESRDFFLGGPLSLYLRRYYASLLEADGRVQSALGPNWSHTFDVRLTRDGETRIEAVNNRGRVVTFEHDGATWQQADKRDYPLQLVEQAGSFLLANPRTHLIYIFDSEGLFTAITDNNNNTLTLSYDNDRLDAVTDGLGRALTFSYDGDGHLTTVTDDTGRSMAYGYTDGLLTSFTNAAGETTTYSYTEAGGRAALLVAATRPEGRAHYTQTYDNQGRVATQTDALGGTLTLNYDLQRTEVMDALGGVFEHAYTQEGLLSSFTDEVGQVVEMGYDEQGRRNQITDRLGAVTTFNYDGASGLLLSSTEANGATTTNSYTERAAGAFSFHDLTTIGLADGTSVSIERDARGNPIMVTDQAGGTWTYTYNDHGQIATATNAKGGTMTNSYNADGMLASRQDPMGNTTSYGYDGLRRLTLITRADGSSRSYSYDEADRLVGLTGERGQVFSFSYDQNSNLTRVEDPTGTTMYSYDAMDRLTQVTDRMGQASMLSYDALGRLERLTDRNGVAEQMSYDALGRVATYTDGGGQSWQYAYDAEGLPTATTNPEGETYSYTTNEMGWLTEVTSPLAHTMAFTYDAMGRVTTMRDAMGQHTTYSYDARGLATAMALPGGASASYGRDGLGALDQVRDAGSNTWGYDRDVVGRLASSSDPLGQVTAYSYDARHRPVQQAFPGTGSSLTRGYDATSNLVSASYSEGPNHSYSYDALHRLKAATDVSLARNGQGYVTESNGLSLGRDSEGRLTSVALPGGQVQYRYNARNLLTEVEDWLGGVTTFTYDGAGRVTTITRPNGTVTSYSYDAGGRLVGMEETDGTGKDAATLASVAMERDARGYITSATRSEPLSPTLLRQHEEWTFDAASQVVNYQYDAMGRLTDDGDRTYTWDGASRLTSYTEQGQTVRFSYDGFGNRLTREVDGRTQQYVWNYGLGLPSVSVEREGGSDVHYYVHTPGGQLLYRVEAVEASRQYYHYDERGNTVLMTGEEAEVIASYAYSPYGEVLASRGEVENVYTYEGATGVMREGETGLYYARARYYDSERGRFISRDPVKALGAGEINPYPYAGGNPTNYIDPTGLRRRISRPSSSAGVFSSTLLGIDDRTVFHIFFGPLVFSFEIFEGALQSDHISSRQARREPTRPGYSQDYVGVELTSNKRLSNNWSSGGVVVPSNWEEDLGPPTMHKVLLGATHAITRDVVPGSTGSGAFSQTFLNTNWQVGVRGSYTVPSIPLDVSNVGIRQGFPQPVVSPPDISPPNSNVGRLGNLFEYELGVDVFNILNAETVLQQRREANLSTFGGPTEILGPRIPRSGARVEF